MSNELHTEISVLDITAGFLLGFDDVVTLLGHVLDEHFLKSDVRTFNSTKDER